MDRVPSTAVPSGVAATATALDRAAAIAQDFLAGLPSRHVGTTASLEVLRERFGGPLPDPGEDPVSVVETLAANAEGGLVASAGPRYFGFVIGGALPAALAADWLTSAWDQNAGLYVVGPAAAVVEEVAGAWLADLLGLPGDASVGFITGARWPPSPASPRAPPRCSRTPAGTSRPGAVRRPGDPRRRRRGGPRDDLHGAPDARPRPRSRHPDPDRRSGPDACRCAGGRPGLADRPASCARRPAT